MRMRPFVSNKRNMLAGQLSLRGEALRSAFCHRPGCVSKKESHTFLQNILRRLYCMLRQGVNPVISGLNGTYFEKPDHSIIEKITEETNV